MNVATTKSVPPSVTMSDNEPGNRLDEAEFLARETEQAKAAMACLLHEMKHSVQTAADLRLWARQHPWMTVGVAAAAGFATATAVVPTKHRPGEARSNGYAYPPEQQRAAAATGASYSSQRSAMMTSLLAPLLDMAKVAVQSTIASAMGAAMQTSAADVAAAAREQARQENAAAGERPPSQGESGEFTATL